MRRWTIAGMLGLVAMLGLGMAALRDSGGVWAAVAPGLAGASFLAAASLAILRRGRSPGLAAFAAVGGAYFLTSWPMGYAPRNLPVASTAIERVVSEMDAVANAKPRERHPELKIYVGIKVPDAGLFAVHMEKHADELRRGSWMSHRHERLNFGRKIAHSWLSLALGGLAALAATLIFGRRPRYDGSGREPQSRGVRPETVSEATRNVLLSPGRGEIV